MPLNFPIMKGTANMATGADPHFEVPLFSHVIDNLWQGCSPAEFPDLIEQDGGLYYANLSGEPVQCKWVYADKKNPTDIDTPRFDKILNLYPWGKYVVPAGTEKIDVVAYDGNEVDWDTFFKASIKVMDWLNEGHRVLVHCQAGLNRSSFVVALVLIQKYGMSPDEAIDRIRKSRSPLCLCNDAFRQYLKGLV